MTLSLAWSGSIDAASPEGSNTGIILRQGQKITIGARGWVKRGKENHTLAGPQGVAGQPDGQGVLKGKIGDRVFIVGNYLIDFASPAEGELSLFVADGKNFYSDNSGHFQADVFMESSTNNAYGYEDLTTFDGKNWNGWQTGEATTRATLEESKKYVLRLMTYPEEKNAGIVVHKKLTGLQPGQSYRFAVRATRIIGKYKEPRLSLQADGTAITPVITLSLTGQPYILQGKFTAQGDSATLCVVSHEADAMGNDYIISELRVTD